MNHNLKTFPKPDQSPKEWNYPFVASVLNWKEDFEAELRSRLGTDDILFVTKGCISIKEILGE